MPLRYISGQGVTASISIIQYAYMDSLFAVSYARYVRGRESQVRLM